MSDPQNRRWGRFGGSVGEGGTGADVLEGRLRIMAPETGEDVTDFHIKGAAYTL
jgi:hypothetical protein